jgi:hypothetical protein
MPNKPIPQEVAVDAKTTALLVLDLNCRCEDPKEVDNTFIETEAGLLTVRSPEYCCEAKTLDRVWSSIEFR